MTSLSLPRWHVADELVLVMRKNRRDERCRKTTITFCGPVLGTIYIQPEGPQAPLTRIYYDARRIHCMMACTALQHHLGIESQELHGPDYRVAHSSAGSYLFVGA